MQQDAFSWLVWGRARAQGATAAQAKRKLQVPAQGERETGNELEGEWEYGSSWGKESVKRGNDTERRKRAG